VRHVVFETLWVFLIKIKCCLFLLFVLEDAPEEKPTNEKEASLPREKPATLDEKLPTIELNRWRILSWKCS